MSKTQLQTNNAKLEALLTELQGKAAGGGGSELQVVSGTFVPSTYQNLYTNPVTISGLGFKPKVACVRFYRNLDEERQSVNLYTVRSSLTTNYYYLLGFVADSDGPVNYTSIRKDNNNHFHVTSCHLPSNVNVSLTDDGFTFYVAGTTDTVCLFGDTSYTYYAIA